MDDIWFKVKGPYPVPRGGSRGSWRVELQTTRDFWKSSDYPELKDLSKSRGCYVFALKPPGGGLRPVYVGQTSNKFSAATFQHHHLTLFSERLADRSGTLQLFFVVYPRNKETTKRNAKARVSETVKEDMRDMENRLIGLALKKNSDDLLNIQGKRRLRIEGVLDPERGQPSGPAVALKKTLAL